MPHRGPIRPFDDRQNEIADGIRRGLTYKQIGCLLGISPHTVADDVEKMALLFDAYHEGELGEHLPPRHIVLVYAAYRHLEAQALERAEHVTRARESLKPAAR